LLSALVPLSNCLSFFKCRFLLAALLIITFSNAFSSPSEFLPDSAKGKSPAGTPSDTCLQASAGNLSVLQDSGKAGISKPSGMDTTHFSMGEKESGLSWIWMISAVLIVLSMLVLFLHLLRKFVFRPFSGQVSGGGFQLLQQFHLGPKKSIAVVKIYGRILVLGVTETTITSLCEISDPEKLAEIESQLSATGRLPNTAFRDIYRKFLSRDKS
jgi:flagellar biosynthetic protein FliO